MTESLGILLANVSAFVTEAFDWVAQAGEMIISNEVLMIFAVAVPLVGLGVGLFRRLAGNL